MGFFKVCKNDHLLKLVRDNFQGTALRVPDTMIQPLFIYGWDGKKKKSKKGMLHGMLVDGDSFNMELDVSQIPDLSGKKTKRANLGLGLELLGGFIKPLGFTVNPFSFAFKGVKQITFSFENVQRHFVDKGDLGNELANHVLNVNHPNVAEFKNGTFQLVLIDSIITSTSFSMHVEKSSDTDFALKAEAIDEAVGSLDVKGDVKVENEKKLTFNGEAPMPFAITSTIMEVDWATGEVVAFKSTEGPDSLTKEVAKDAVAVVGSEGDIIEWE